jgi:hypothetical protein
MSAITPGQVAALDTIAPYPATSEEVSAESLTAALAARAYLLYCGLSDSPERTVEAAAVAQTYGVISLLGRISRTEGTQVADGLARNLWHEWRDIEGLWSELAEVLKMSGIDPDDIAEAAQAEQNGGAQ